MLSVGCLIVGCLLISWSAFLYETEERQVGEILLAWWVSLDDTACASLSRNVRFVRYVSTLVSNWLDSIFGRTLLSVRAVSSSLCLSVSSLLLLAVCINFKTESWTSLSIMFVLASIFLGVALTRQLPLLRFLAALTIISIILIGVVLIDSTDLPRFGYRTYLAWGIATTAGVVADFSVILITRYAASRGGRVNTVLWPVIISITNATLAIAIFVAPLLLVRGRNGHTQLRATILLFGLTNLYAAIIAASFIILPVSLLVQRLFWPLINRPVYAMHRFALFQQRKVLFGAGTILMAVGSHTLFDLLGSVGHLLIP